MRDRKILKFPHCDLPGILPYEKFDVPFFVFLCRRGSLQPSGRPIDDGHLGVPGHIWNRSPSGRRASLQPDMIPNLDVPQTTSRRSSLRYFPNSILSISQMNHFFFFQLFFRRGSKIEISCGNSRCDSDRYFYCKIRCIFTYLQ